MLSNIFGFSSQTVKSIWIPMCWTQHRLNIFDGFSFICEQNPKARRNYLQHFELRERPLWMLRVFKFTSILPPPWKFRVRGNRQKISHPGWLGPLGSPPRVASTVWKKTAQRNLTFFAMNFYHPGVSGASFGNIWSSLEAALRIVQPLGHVGTGKWGKPRLCFRFRNMCTLLTWQPARIHLLSFYLVRGRLSSPCIPMNWLTIWEVLIGRPRFFLLRWWKGGTLQGTNVSPLKVAGKMTFLFAVVSFRGPFGGRSTCSWHDFHTTRFVFFENWSFW